MVNRNPITADVMFVKLKYNLVLEIAAGTVTQTSYKFRGNSLYDPDASSLSGTQPMGYDQYSQFYERAIVLGSKIRIKFLNAGTNLPIQMCVYPSLSSAATQVDGSLREIPFGRTKYVSMVGNALKIEHMSNYMSTAKIYQVSKQHVKDTANYSHTNGTNPVNEWFWYWTLQNNGLSAQATGGYGDVEITYYAMFKRRVELDVS